MRKLWAIIRNEYLTNVRRPSFLAGALGMPLMIGAIFLLSTTLATQSADRPLEDFARVGYVDRSAESLLEPDVIPEEAVGRFERFDSLEAARAALDAGEIGVYFEVTANYLQDGRINVYSIQPVPEAITDRIDSMMLQNLLANVDTPIPAERFESATGELTVRALDTNRTVSGDGLVLLFLLPLLFGMFMVFSSMTTSSFMMYSLVEEKTNRIMEVLVTSVRPMQLLGGKILGLGLVGLTQVAIIIGMLLVVLGLAQQTDFLNGLSLPLDVLLVALVFFVLSFLMMSSLQAGLAVLVGSEQEGSQLTGLLILPFMIPLFAMVAFITEPNGTLAQVLTFIPFTAPMTVVFRMSMTVVPLWEIVASIAITALATVLLIWLSARVFRWGMLLYGKKFSPMGILKAIRPGSGGAVQTTAPITREGL